MKNVIIHILLYLLMSASPLTSIPFFYTFRFFFFFFLLVHIFYFLLKTKPKFNLNDHQFTISTILLIYLIINMALKTMFLTSLTFLSLFLFSLLLQIKDITSYEIKKIFLFFNKFLNFTSFLFLFFYILKIFVGIQMPFLFYNEDNVYNFFGINITPIYGLADQSSTISLVLAIPLSISFILGEKIRKFIFTLVILLFSLGGSFYMSLIIFLFSSLFLKNKKKHLLYLPFISIILFIIFSFYFTYTLDKSTFNVLIGEDDEVRTLLRKELLGSTYDSNFSQIPYYLFVRIGSAFERMVTLIWECSSFLNNFIFGSFIKHEFSALGSILIKYGVYGGFFSFFCFLIYIFRTLKRLLFLNSNTYILIFTYSLIFQSIVFNENGFSSTFYFFILIIINKIYFLQNQNYEKN